MTAEAKDSDGLLATIRALTRIAAFVKGVDRARVLVLREEAIRLAGRSLAAKRIAAETALSAEVVFAVLSGSPGLNALLDDRHAPRPMRASDEVGGNS